MPNSIFFASAYSGVQNIPQWQVPASGISFSIAGLQGHILPSTLCGFESTSST